jgi:hypothetical protein
MTTKYRVEIDGETVWDGEGDDWTAIPAEYRDRPADTADGEPHPSAHHLFESVGDEETGVHGEADQLFGVQIAHTDELEQIIAYASPVPAEVYAIIAHSAANPDDVEAAKAAAVYHPDDVIAVKAAIVATVQLGRLRAGLTAHPVDEKPVSFVSRSTTEG